MSKRRAPQEKVRIVLGFLDTDTFINMPNPD